MGRYFARAKPEDLPSIMIYQLAFGGKAVDVRTTGANLCLRHPHLLHGSGFLNNFLSKKYRKKSKTFTAMKKQMLLGAAVIMASTIYGQRNDSTQTNLDEVIVTANKVSQKQSQTGKVISVINKEQIEKSAGKTVAQLLSEQAGIFVSGANNNAGSVQTIFMRGASSGRTLVLVDGIPVNDPSDINNNFDLNLFAINDVERIEICKGAQSTLYGSDAVAGVINIITVKSDVSKAVNLKATLASGNYGTLKGNAQLYGKVAGLTYIARYAKLKTDGFSAANDKAGTGYFDNDAYNSDVASASLIYDITNQFSARTYVQYSKYKTDIDYSAFTDDNAYTSKSKGLMAGANLQYKTDAVTVTANYQYSDITRNLFDDSVRVASSLSRNDYFGKSQFVEVFANIKMGKNFSLVQGADYRNNKMNSNGFGTYRFSNTLYTYGSSLDSGISQGSLYASLTYTGLQSKLNIDLGGRLNVNSRYGSNSSYSFNPSYKFNEHVRLMGSISTAYKTPTIYQLYSAYGNKDLQVEDARNYEIGVQVEEKSFSNRLIYFYRNTNSLIDYNSITNKYFNINQQIDRGFEYELKASPSKGLGITANYTFISASEYTQSRINYKDTSYNYSIRRPKHTLNLTVGYQVTDAFFISVSGKYVSKRYDNGGYKVADVVLNDYTIFSAYAQYTFNKNIKLFADAKNLGNRKFFDWYGYNAIPFMINGGITINL